MTLVLRNGIAARLGALLVVSLGTVSGQVVAQTQFAGTLTRQVFFPQSQAVTPARQATTAKAAANLPDQVFADGSNDAAKTEADAKKQERLQKIQQLAFDRRPSTILKSWSTPREVDLDEALKSSTNNQAGNPQPARVSRLVGPNGVVVQGAATPQPSTTEPAKPDPFVRELKGFQRDVTLSDWTAVKAYLARLEKEEGKALYGQLLQTLASGAAGPGGMMPQMQVQMMNGMPVQANPQQYMMEKNVFSNSDVIALAWVAPQVLEKERLDQVGQILRQAIDQGHAVEDFVARVKAELKKPEKERALGERPAAKLLMASGSAVEAGAFLPSPEKAVADNDREALNLLARHFLALHDREKKTVHLEQAWKVTQAALASGKVERDQKEEAIRRAVELTPKIKENLGRAWLETSFTDRPERGMEIIAAIGAGASQGLQTHPFDPDFRLKSLELQKMAVEAVLAKAPGRGKEWAHSLGLLAEAWLKEAEFSRSFDLSTSLGPRMQFDGFGNMFYSNWDMSPEMMMQRQGNMPKALVTGEVIKNRPGDAWLACLDEGMKPKFSTVLAQLYLKVNEEEKAFPYIERLSATHPRQAKDLAEEFVRTWTKNHDPNSQQMRRSRFFYIYGFESRAEGIPLTRSKQERNIVELAEWVKRLRKLPIGEIDEKLLTGAFTACHSAAEVYRLDAINRVFGSFDALKPTTLAELIQQMRGNLVGVWRRPDEQEKNKTKRREKDIRAEVIRGYEVARAVVDQGLKQHPDHWALVLARASILHDENNYRQELEKSPEFAPRRSQAFREFQKASRLYVAAAPKLPQDEQSTQVFEIWFSAGLGACDIQHITDETLPDAKQPALIKQALESLPGEDRERHLSKFANTLFTRLSNVKPSVKVRYLKHGFDIVGDHPQAHDARKVYDYYKDLVTEIKLESVVDGSDVVGHERPFGVFVNLKHTREIERESGGFGRYLQNQNSNNMFYYNFGRPLENYRDKFQEIAKQSLGEQFEILSVTFQDEKVNSKATEEYGWRVTPYAYMLLKARGPKVDKIPPVRLDLDFMDTSGYVILPVESATIPIDASPNGSPERPHEKLQITQTLDERQSKDGKLILEVKATTLGLVPDLDRILGVDQPGFEVEKTEDQGLSVSRFNPDSPATRVDSDRTWLVHYRGAVGQVEPSQTFRFARSKVDGAELVYQRYVDADLAKVGPEVPLEARYGDTSRAWAWWLGGGLLAAALGIPAIFAYLRSRPRRIKTSRFAMPQQLTPFSVLGLLREIKQNNGLPAPESRALVDSIEQIERHYFAEANGAAPDLKTIAETWIRRAS